jgi:hypothetical protein
MSDSDDEGVAAAPPIDLEDKPDECLESSEDTDQGVPLNDEESTIPHLPTEILEKILCFAAGFQSPLRPSVEQAMRLPPCTYKQVLMIQSWRLVSKDFKGLADELSWRADGFRAMRHFAQTGQKPLTAGNLNFSNAKNVTEEPRPLFLSSDCIFSKQKCRGGYFPTCTATPEVWDYFKRELALDNEHLRHKITCCIRDPQKHTWTAGEALKNAQRDSCYQSIRGVSVFPYKPCKPCLSGTPVTDTVIEEVNGNPQHIKLHNVGGRQPLFSDLMSHVTTLECIYNARCITIADMPSVTHLTLTQHDDSFVVRELKITGENLRTLVLQRCMLKNQSPVAVVSDTTLHSLEKIQLEGYPGQKTVVLDVQALIGEQEKSTEYDVLPLLHAHAPFMFTKEPPIHAVSALGYP